MNFNKFHGKIFGVQLSKKEQDALDAEIRSQIVELDKQHSRDVDTMILYTLMKYAGFGKKKLHDFWIALKEEHDNLIQKYEMPDEYIWLAELKLKEAGVDINKWEQELGEDK